MSEFAKFSSKPTHTDQLHSGNGLVIRPAEKSDLDILADITAIREGTAAAAWRESLGRFYADTSTGQTLLLVAALHRKIIGFGKAAFFSPPDNAPENTIPAGWYLSGMIIRPQYRRRGVGAALTSARLSRIAETADRLFYFSNARNTVSIALHTRFGFVELTRNFHVPNVQFEGGEGILFFCDVSSQLLYHG